MALPRLVLIYEPEAACRTWLAAQGFAERQALEISCYLAARNGGSASPVRCPKPIPCAAPHPCPLPVKNGERETSALQQIVGVRDWHQQRRPLSPFFTGRG
jgi:hypothetical protein